MFWELPGPNGFVVALADSLAQGRHVMSVVPERFLWAELLAHLERLLNREGVGSLTAVTPDTAQATKGLVECLTPQLSWCAGVEDEREFLESDDAPSRVLCILLPDGGSVSHEGLHRLLLMASDIARIQGRRSFSFLHW